MAGNNVLKCFGLVRLEGLDDCIMLSVLQNAYKEANEGSSLSGRRAQIGGVF